MSPLRLNGSTSGYSQIDAPAIAGDQTFTLPTTGGTLDRINRTGNILQVVSVDGAYATGTTAIPLDNSIPQSTEGTQFISLSITPTNLNSKLLIEVVATHTSSAADWISGAIFQDSTANALAATASYMDTAGGGAVLTLQHYMTAGTTSSTTFKYRAGMGGAGTIGFKGSASINWFGGLTVGRMTITEIAA